MSAESIFRALFLILFLAGSTVRAYYARKHVAERKKRSVLERLKQTAEFEGVFCSTLMMIQGINLTVAMVLYVFFLPKISWTQLFLPDWLRWLGVGLGAVSLPFLIWVQHTLGKHWTVSLEIRDEHRLVTSGPYRWVRHPMYTVHVVYFLAWVLVSANLFLLINYILTLVLIFARIPKEERMLLERFGDEYRAYMKRTGPLIPRFLPSSDQNETVVPA